MSSTELLRAYWSERYPVLVYLPLAALVFVVGAVAVGATITPANAAEGTALVFALVLLFRVWDDVVDRHEDRVRAPGRVVPRAPGIAPFVGLMAALAVACTALLLLRGRAAELSLVAALWLALAGWYAARRRIGVGPLAHAHVLLLKYPVIALAASPPHDAPRAAGLLAALGALYLGLCIRELLDDARLRTVRGYRWIVGAELATLAALLFVTLSTGGLTS